MHIAKNIGVTSFRVYWMRSKCGKFYWCRKAIAIMGDFNMSYKVVVKMSPFDPNFNDNYVEGKGKTKKEALVNMEKEEENLTNSFWAI